MSPGVRRAVAPQWLRRWRERTPVPLASHPRLTTLPHPLHRYPNLAPLCSSHHFHKALSRAHRRLKLPQRRLRVAWIPH